MKSEISRNKKLVCDFNELPALLELRAWKFHCKCTEISKMVDERQSNQRRPVFPLLGQPSAKIGAGKGPGTVSAEMASSSFLFLFSRLVPIQHFLI